MLPFTNRGEARAAAEKVAAALRAGASPQEGPLTLGQLFDNYVREVSPRKSESKSKHDVRAAQLFIECFRRNREARTLSVRDWDRFIQLRRSGTLRPRKHASTAEQAVRNQKLRPVRDRVIAYDLQFLRAALKWATLAGDGQGGTLLDRSPLQGLPLPREESPQRPTLSDEQFHALLRVAPGVGGKFELALVLAHETGHRISSIRQIRWGDIDLDGRTVRWRADSDKIGFEHTTLLTEDAHAALQRERQQNPGIGDVWLFPDAEDPAKPCSRHVLVHGWRRAAKLAGLPKGKRLGWHSLRRKFATELKDAPLRDLCYLGGWKEPTTVLTCYQHPDRETQRSALERRKKVNVSATG